MPREVHRVLALQDGVIARRQALDAGLAENDVARLIRRREWVRLLPGVYVNHTGEPTWRQRAWAGVLYYAPSALADRSAMPAHGDGPIWLAVDAARSVSPRPGYRIRYLAKYDDQVLSHASPPRMRLEEACLNLVRASNSPLDRVQLLAEASASRRTTPGRLTAALSRRTRMPHRTWLKSVLRDIADGTCSVLEHGYLTQVERPHGLPRGHRQQPERDDRGALYRDVAYPDFGQLVELDGRMGHDDAVSRDADLERDLDAAVTRRGTVRLGWGQVFGRPCSTAAKVGLLLRAGGWTGRPRSCGPGCGVGYL